ncbi:MAG: DUF2017 family protein [Acidimicrobiales bacterium]
MIFSRRRDGTIAVDLPAELRDLLTRLVDDLRDLLLSDSDERLRRLYPTAHPDHEDLDGEYHQLMHGDLIESRLAALETTEESLRAESLTDEQLASWMQATNSLRLVLGTQLDVSEDDHGIDAQHPDAPTYALYDLLNLMLGEMVDILSGALPPG